MLPRKQIRFAVQLPALFSGDTRSGEGTIFDLSTEGCAVISDRRPSVSSYLTLRIDLPSEDSPLVIDLAGVRWSTEEKFGLEFIRMEPNELERLRLFVKSLEVEPTL